MGEHAPLLLSLGRVADATVHRLRPAGRHGERPHLGRADGRDFGEPEVAAAGQDVSELTLAHGAHAAPMIDRLDDFHRSNPDALIDFPPKLQTVPCKPLLFDLARNEIAYPDIGDRVKSKSRSWLGGKASSWFGRG